MEIATMGKYALLFTLLLLASTLTTQRVEAVPNNQGGGIDPVSGLEEIPPPQQFTKSRMKKRFRP